MINVGSRYFAAKDAWMGYGEGKEKTVAEKKERCI